MNLGEQLQPAPVDAAHAADVSAIRTREEEEKFAKQHSMPTRLLGWLLIGGFALQIIGGLTGNTTDLGGLLFLIAGICVLKGSQGWLRFVTFFCVPGAVLGMVSLTWTLIHQRPLEIDHHWYGVTDQKFWTLGVSPLVYIAAEGVLAVLALRTRRLRFWTKTVRIWAAIFSVILLIAWGIAARDWFRNRDLARDYATEIGLARSHIKACTSTIFYDHDRFVGFPQIEEVDWHSSGNSISGIYSRMRYPELAPRQRPGAKRSYTEWLRDGSGKVGQLEIQFILPENP